MDEEPAADLDLRCAAHHIIKNIEKLDTARDQWYKPVKDLSERLMPLTKCLRRHQSATAKEVAGKFHLAFLAVAILLIGWPDWKLPICYFIGFRSVGVIGITNVFKPTKGAPGFLHRSELLAGAEEAIDNIVKTVPRPEDAEAIMAACIKDKSKNFADQLRDKAAMDARWGPGNWVAIPTFDYIQASGKPEKPP